MLYVAPNPFLPNTICLNQETMTTVNRGTSVLFDLTISSEKKEICYDMVSSIMKI